MNVLQTLLRAGLALMLLTGAMSPARADEVLEPEKAFVFSARALDRQTLEVRYRIVDGYYLYKDKFRFEIEGGTPGIGPLVLPPGKIKEDEFFGRVETYRGDLVLKVPLQEAAAGTRSIVLKSTVQGCADVGICYPPLTQSARLTLPGDTGPSLFGGLLGPAGDEALLPPEKAFRVDVQARDAQSLVVDIRMAPDHYLYRDRLQFSIKESGTRIPAIQWPAAENKQDPALGRMAIYRGSVRLIVPLQHEGPPRQNITLLVGLQGCNEKRGVCFPPETRSFNLVLPPPGSAAITPPIPAAAIPDSVAPTEDGAVLQLLQGSSFWWAVASFFGFGLVLALTPCVFPMIPILSGIIVGQGRSLTKTRGLLLSLAYVQGMALTYAIAGVIAGLSGALLANSLQNPWVLGGFAAVFVVLALSMFGYFELQVPSFLQSRLTESSNRLKGGRFLAVFVMGALSALIVGPCVAPALAGALIYISQSRDVVLGGVALYALALGMGLPLLLVGVSAGALLPRAGGWMKAVKQGFGVLLLGVAIWMVSPFLPALLHMLAWAALLIVVSIYLHALDPLPANASGALKFWKGVGIIALLCGAALLFGALSGNRDILQPLTGIRSSTAAPVAPSASAPLKFEKVRNIAELESRIKQSAGKFVMLDFYADWCVSCKEFERFTLGDPRVQQRLADVVLLKADVTANTPDDQQLLKKFGLFGPPGIIFYDPQGQEKLKLVGELAPGPFLQRLEAILR